MLKNKLFCSMVVFAAAAIFAVTLVGCGEADTKTEYVPQAKVPVDLVTASGVLAALFAENSEVILTKGTNGAEVATLAAGWTVPVGKTLNLNGYGLSLGNYNLILLGSLSGFKNPDGGGKQITAAGTGVVVGKESAIEVVTDYVTATKAVAGYSKDNTTVTDTTAQTYYFDDYTATVATTFTPALPGSGSVTTIVGNVSISSADAAVALPSLSLVTGTVTLNGTHETTASVFTAGAESNALTISGNLVTNPKAQLKIAASDTVTIKGSYTIGEGVSIANGSIAVASSDTAITVVTPEEGTPSFDVTNLTLVGLTVDGSKVDLKSSTTFSLTKTSIEKGGYVAATGFSGKVTVAAGGVVTHTAEIFSVDAGGSLVCPTGILLAASKAKIATGTITGGLTFTNELEVSGYIMMTADSAQITMKNASAKLSLLAGSGGPGGSVVFATTGTGATITAACAVTATAADKFTITASKGISDVNAAKVSMSAVDGAAITIAGYGTGVAVFKKANLVLAEG